MVKYSNTYSIPIIPSSHRRRIDGELNRRAKRRQSVKTVIQREKALSNSGHSARAPKNFKLFKILRRSVKNCVKRGVLKLIKAYQSLSKGIKAYKSVI